jgi:hypothetical protein
MKITSGNSSQKIISAAISLFIIGLILLSGPASAYKVYLENFSNSSPVAGETISILSEIEINSNERIDFNSIELYINNALVCSFKAGGDKACSYVKAEFISSFSNAGLGYGYGYAYGYENGHGYGYGYNNGYSNGKLVYNISIDTSGFGSGTYILKIKANPDSSGLYSKEAEKSFTVSVNSVSSSSGSSGSNTNDNQCITGWSCSSWGNCVNGYENRVCVKSEDRCNTNTPKPFERRNCENENNINDNENNNENSNPNTNTNTNPLTGQVIGGFENFSLKDFAKNNTGIIIFTIIIIGAIVGVSIFRFRRIRRMKGFTSSADVSYNSAFS